MAVRFPDRRWRWKSSLYARIFFLFAFFLSRDLLSLFSFFSVIVSKHIEIIQQFVSCLVLMFHFSICIQAFLSSNVYMKRIGLRVQLSFFSPKLEIKNDLSRSCVLFKFYIYFKISLIIYYL